MPISEYEDDGCESVDEDAELELSCALHNLAERVKQFEVNMIGRLRNCGVDVEEDDEEIGEDIPDADEEDGEDPSVVSYGLASPKRKAESVRKHQRQRRFAKQSKQQDDDDSDDCYDDESEEEEEEQDAKHSESKICCNNPASDWDEQNEREELSEMKHNISLLLQGIKEQAKVLVASMDAENQ